MEKYYIRANRAFYKKHKDWLKDWIPKIKEFENSHQKFEWNCGDKVPLVINDKIVQFRPSGIRVKMPTYSPALVLTTTQIPIFPWIVTPNGEKGRYMTKAEAAKLQCMEGLEKLPPTIAKAFKALGNDYLGVPLSGRAFRCNLFARSLQKGFSLQSLTQQTSTTNHKSAA